MTLSNEILNEHFIADFENGKLYRKSNGKECVSLDMKHKYYRVSCENSSYAVHRILWQMKYGSLPKFIDHINLNGLDNRIENLRTCSHKENNRNKKITSINTLGFKGVWYERNSCKYHSAITVDYKKIHLKSCLTAKAAAVYYDFAAVKYHGDFAMTNKKLGLL